jgi:alpha-D-xyloside xylohydrolase
LKKFVELKLRLMPYFYSVAIDTHETGVPMMRSMFMEFPEDPISWTLDTQFMLGPNILVAPLFSADGVVQFYVPEGEWYGLLDGKMRKGPGFFTETHDVFSMPVLLRPRTAVTYVLVAHPENPTYDYTDNVRVLINARREDEDFDVVVNVPDSAKPGSLAATLKVSYNSATNVLEEKVASGTMKTWNVGFTHDHNLQGLFQ